jgi:transcriptional regulator with XRE-family HTH domain
MKQIAEYILKETKEQGLTLENLASQIGLSRMGLHKALNVNESLRLADFIKIIEVLEINSYDLLESIDHISVNFDWKLDPIAINQIYSVLEFKNLNTDQFNLYMSDKIIEDENIDILEFITYEKLEAYCENTNIPFDLFLQDKYRKQYKFITIKDYINNNRFVETIEYIDLYQQSFKKSLFEIIGILRKFYLFESNEKPKEDDIILYAKQLTGDSTLQTNTYNIAFIKDNIHKPLIFISKLPNETSNITTQTAFQKVEGFFFEEPIHNQSFWVEHLYSDIESKCVINFIKLDINDNKLLRYNIKKLNSDNIEYDEEDLATWFRS